LKFWEKEQTLFKPTTRYDTTTKAEKKIRRANNGNKKELTI